jgi:thioredoxin 1
MHLKEEDFEREVLKSGVPTVVDFYADWCGPCRMVSPIIESLSREYAGRVKFVKVDTDDNQALATRYEVMSIPTVMIFNGGRIADTVIGAAPAEVYRRKINANLNGERQMPRFPCTECGEGFPTEEALLAHVGGVHSPDVEAGEHPRTEPSLRASSRVSK